MQIKCKNKLIISNTLCIIGFLKINILDILNKLYKEIL